jgi:hypothetical protein
MTVKKPFDPTTVPCVHGKREGNPCGKTPTRNGFCKEHLAEIDRKLAAFLPELKEIVRRWVREGKN